jgi:aconitate hydratase 2/2-methylisocitrate dehydratase
MGNQARVAPKSTVVSTSTRNFPNRLGDGANVFLASSELAAVCSALGHIPTMEEYLKFMGKLDTMAGGIYRYLNFNEVAEFMKGAEKAATIPLQNIVEVA